MKIIIPSFSVQAIRPPCGGLPYRVLQERHRPEASVTTYTS
ncbi:MAG: hypothetical protein WA517_13705 [Candidatus Acidiferrum sp.]